MMPINSSLEILVMLHNLSLNLTSQIFFAACLNYYFGFLTDLISSGPLLTPPIHLKHYYAFCVLECIMSEFPIFLLNDSIIIKLEGPHPKAENATF